MVTIRVVIGHQIITKSALSSVRFAAQKVAAMPLAAKPPAVAVSSPMRRNDEAAYPSRKMHQ